MSAGRCSHSKCQRAARWRVGFRAWAKGYAKGSHPPVEAYFQQYVVCDEHREGIKIEDLLLPEGRAKIEAAHRAIGKAPPDCDGAEVAFQNVLSDHMPSPPVGRRH